jgi:uncharacterized protein (TIGR02466 family)
MSNRELLQLFPIPVLISKYEKDLSEELEYVKSLEYNLNTPETQKIYSKQSSDTFLLDNPQLKNIREFIDSQINFYVNDVLECSNKLKITQSWANITDNGKKHHEHRHPNSIVSGVFYFQINKTLPPIEFRNKNNEMYSFTIKNHNNFNAETFLLPLETGELILFPSTLYHGVPENVSTTPRISLAFNTFETESLGKIESLTYLPLK